MTTIKMLAARLWMGPATRSLGLVALCSVWAAGLPAQVTALVGGTVVPGTGGPVIEDAVVLIREGRIVAAGPRALTRVPAGAERIDATGRWLLPGLTDMHVHFSADGPDHLASARWILPTLLSYGVTTIKEAGFFRANADSLKALLSDGVLAGPTLITSGRTINGSAAERVFLDPAAGREGVERSVAFGADFIKIHNFISPEALDTIVAVARRHGLRVTGHVPLSMTMSDAVARGLYGLEHVRVRPQEVLRDTSIVARYPITLPVQQRELFWQYVDPSAQEPRALIEVLRRHDVYFDPTLVVDEVQARHAATQRRIAGLPLPKDLEEEWNRDRYMVGLTPDDQAAWESALKARMGFVAAAFHAGILLTAGTDSWIPNVYPGEALHEELQLLVEAGLTPLEAIQTATANAARALGHPGQFGVVAAGAWADLVMLRNNPLENIARTRDIVAVWKHGKRFDPAALRQEARRALATPR